MSNEKAFVAKYHGYNHGRAVVSITLPLEDEVGRSTDERYTKDSDLDTLTGAMSNDQKHVLSALLHSEKLPEEVAVKLNSDSIWVGFDDERTALECLHTVAAIVSGALDYDTWHIPKDDVTHNQALADYQSQYGKSPEFVYNRDRTPEVFVGTHQI